MKEKCYLSVLKLLKFLLEVISRQNAACYLSNSQFKAHSGTSNFRHVYLLKRKKKKKYLPPQHNLICRHIPGLSAPLRRLCVIEDEGGRRGYLSVAAFPKPVIETQHEITDYPRVLCRCCAPWPHHSFPLSSQAFFGGSSRLGTVPAALPASGGTIRQRRGSFPGCSAAKYINHFTEPLRCHGTSVLPAVME